MKRGTLVTALLLLALAGLLYHVRSHYFMVTDPLDPAVVRFDGTFFLAFFFSLLDVIVVTCLFLSRRTAVYGFLLNGIIVILGTILMAHFSIAQITAKSLPLSAYLFKSTLPHIGIAWADFFIGKALYDHSIKEKA